MFYFLAQRNSQWRDFQEKVLTLELVCNWPVKKSHRYNRGMLLFHIENVTVGAVDSFNLNSELVRLDKATLSCSMMSPLVYNTWSWRSVPCGNTSKLSTCGSFTNWSASKLSNSSMYLQFPIRYIKSEIIFMIHYTSLWNYQFLKTVSAPLPSAQKKLRKMLTLHR